MQQRQDAVEGPGEHRARFGLGGLVGAVQDRLGELQIPVAECVPDEMIGRVRRIVEAVLLDGFGDGGGRALRFAGDPAVDGLLRAGRVEILRRQAAVHLAEARRVPELGREIAIALDAGGRQLDVAPLRRHRREGEAQRVGAILVDQVEGVHDVPLRLRHLLARLVADQRVDVDRVERHLLHEVQPHHHHPRDPEEDDVEAGDEHRGRVIALQLGRLVRPAERRERPERGGEPGVEHVFVADDLDQPSIVDPVLMLPFRRAHDFALIPRSPETRVKIFWLLNCLFSVEANE